MIGWKVCNLFETPVQISEIPVQFHETPVQKCEILFSDWLKRVTETKAANQNRPSVQLENLIFTVYQFECKRNFECARKPFDYHFRTGKPFAFRSNLVKTCKWVLICIKFSLIFACIILTRNHMIISCNLELIFTRDFEKSKLHSPYGLVLFWAFKITRAN